MRIVDKPVTAPSRCAVIPFLGMTHEGRFVDTGAEIPPSPRDSHVYVSQVAVEEMAALFGWVGPDDIAAALARCDELEAKVADLERELADADVYVKAIDTLESAGFRARKKPGRPRKEEIEVVA